MTLDEKLAVAACVILVACIDDNLRDLSAQERAVALRGRERAGQILMASNIEPTHLKELGLRLLAESAPKS
jgi:hypothetical protein